MNSARVVKRLSIFVEHYPPFLGSDRTIFELSKRVADHGVKVHFVATQPLRHLVGQRPADWKYKENWRRPPPEVHPNITAKYLLLDRRIVSLWRFNRLAALVVTLLLFTVDSIREVIRFRPDVVVAAHASPIVGCVAFASGKLTSRPIVVGCPDWMTAYAAGLVGRSLSSIGPVLLQMVETTLYRLARRIFTVTDFLRRLLVGYGVRPEKISVIPNGVDTSQFSPSVDYSELERKYRLENVTVILYSGHIEEWAGVSVIYDLAVRLDKEAPSSHILLVGGGSAVGPLIKRLQQNNLSHMVTYAGLHPFEEMPKFTAAADIALCLFPDNPVSHAASPLKLFEYMAAGNAIVATSVAGTREVLNSDTCILVKPGSSDEVCRAVVTLCRDPEVRKKMGRRARDLAIQKYSWSRLSEQFLSVCEMSLAHTQEYPPLTHE